MNFLKKIKQKTAKLIYIKQVNSRIKKAKYVHLMFNDKFTKPFVDFLNRNFDSNEHLILCKRVYDNFPFPDENNVIELKYLQRLKFDNIEKIICHSLFDNEVVTYLYKHPKILKNKAYWIVWGGDCHQTPDDKINNFIRCNIKGYISDTDGKCDSAKIKYKSSPEIYTACYPFPINKTIVNNSKRIPHSYIQIQINNSADNTTLDMLDILSKFKHENIKIVTILSYGKMEFKEDIIQKGKEIFGNKFEYYDEYMTEVQYSQHLAQNDILILNQNREQGFGNSIAALAHGSKLFVKSEVATFNHYNSKGIKVFDTNSIKNLTYNDFISYSDTIKNNNIQKISMYFDDEYLKKMWTNVFNSNTRQKKHCKFSFRFIQQVIDILRGKDKSFFTKIIRNINKFILYEIYYPYTYLKRKNNPLKIEEFLKTNKNPKIFLPCSKDDLFGRAFIFKHMKSKQIITPEDKGITPDLLLGFGENHTINEIKTYIKYKKVPIIYTEEAFLRSITMHAEGCDLKYENVHAYFFDDLWFHFNCHKPSRLELMLNDKNLIITEEQKQRARNIINLLVSNKLTKYNHQPIYTPQIGRKGRRKVLVIEQAYQDSSIYGAGAGDKTFDLMLKKAIKENPDSDILVKTHPEQVSGRRGGLKKAYYADVKQTENIYPVNIAINPYSLLETVDKVYVCSSMLGLEALMAGKEVHCFGIPSYAGWGMTIDELKCKRRTNKRTIEEFVYIVYVLYTKYFDEEKYIECEELIDYLLKLRREYFEEFLIKSF